MQTTKQRIEHQIDLTGNITLRTVPTTVRHENKFPISIHHPYVTVYWTGIVGPTTLGLARIVNTLSCAGDGGLTISCKELFIGHLAVGYTGRHSAGRRALRRSIDYGLAYWDNDTTTLTVTRHLSPVPNSRLQYFDDQGVIRHDQMLAVLKNRGQQ